MTTLESGEYCYLHFTNKEIKAESDSITFLSSHSSRIPGLSSNHRKPDPRGHRNKQSLAPTYYKHTAHITHMKLG